MQTEIIVEIPNKKPYPIYINKEPINVLVEQLNKESENKRRLIVISEKVYKLYRKTFKFNKKELFILKDGEEQKNIQNYLKIVNKAVELKLSRKDLIIAIGGGVVGDIAGFVASTYMRGIEFIQVPTTLLAFVDSSVGGKTAVDLPNAKNYIGSFYQPSKVFINLNFLNTLDKRHMLSGYGEIIKYALIEKSCLADKNYLLFDYLSITLDRILEKNPNVLANVIQKCLELKISVVQKDEQEGGLRKILNLGHTYAHALETITNYKKFTHGEAVVYGILFVFDYALATNKITKTYYNLVEDLIKRFGFKDIKRSRFSKRCIIKLMKSDKKSYSDKIVMIVPNEKGSVVEEVIEDVTTFVF